MDKLISTRIDLLKACSLFRDMETEGLESFAREMQEISYKKGDPIFLENELSQQVFFVQSGSVEIVRGTHHDERKRIRLVQQGEHFSELSVLTNSRHSTSALACGDTTLSVVDGHVFLEILQRSPDTARSLMGSLAMNIQRTISESYAVRPFERERMEFSFNMIDALPMGWIKKYRVIPLSFSNKTLHVAMVPPFRPEFFDLFEKKNPQLNLLLSTLREEEFEDLKGTVMDLYMGKTGVAWPEKNKPSSSSCDETLEEFLQFSLMFSQLPKAIMEQIAPFFTLKKFSAGEIVVEQNTPCKELLLIRSGTLELTKKVDEHALYCHVESVSTYDSIGSVSLVSGTWHPMRAIALSDVEVYGFPEELFTQLFATSDFTVPLCTAMAGRLQALNRLPGIDLDVGTDMPLSMITQFTSHKSEEDLVTSPRHELTSQNPEHMLEEILHKAVEERASDVHFEQQEESTVVRCRIDGALTQLWEAFPKATGEIWTNKLKILAHLDISEKRHPQDGQFALTNGEAAINARVSTIPTRYGEKSVLRILKKKGTLIPLNRLAPDKRVIKHLNGLARYRQGLFLVAGPTGSGKTTTLYSLLGEIDKRANNVVTIEDPIELEIPGANQVQLNESIGLTYDAILRSVLRQDPDIILVGEIRDQRSLQLVFQAALTGHLVLATIHAPNSTQIVPRLIELGASKAQIAASLIGALSQRLVRRVCSECKTSRSVNGQELEIFRNSLSGSLPTQVMTGQGCSSCNSQGFYGRLPLFEFWQKTDKVRDVLLNEGGMRDFLTALKEDGFEDMGGYGVRMAANGLTTLTEVERTIFGLCSFQIEGQEGEAA